MDTRSSSKFAEPRSHLTREKATLKVSEAVSRTLAEFDVDTVFGLVGDGNFAYLDSYVAAGGRLITVAHEATAVAMADGYSRALGCVGVASVTHGPGLTNSMTALVEGVKHSSELLVLTSSTHPVRGLFQELDVRGFCHAAGAQFERVFSPHSVVRDIALAWRRVRTTHTPVVLDIPAGMLEVAVPSAESTRPSFAVQVAPARPREPDPDSIDLALGLIMSSKRPVILAGRGAVQSNAKHSLAQLADALAAPLSTTLLAKDLFRGHPDNLGIFGSLATETATEVLSQSDCVVAFGASLNRFTSDSGALLGGSHRVVHCDVNPERIGIHTPADEAVAGDATTTSDAMIHQLRTAGHTGGLRARESLRQRLRDEVRYAYRDRSRPGFIDLRTAVSALDAILPRSRSLVTDLGRFQRVAWTHVNVEHPTDFTHTANFGAMGLGIGIALGVSVARPDRPTLAVLGDGGFMAAAQELHVAVRNRLPLVVAVANDGAYGAEWDKLVQSGRDPALSRNNWPNFVDLALAMGVEAHAIKTQTDLNDLRGALGAKVGSGPMLLDIHIDPELSIHPPPPR